MDKVFIYWDNSNIYIGAKDMAAEREGGSAYHRVRLDFANLLQLASGGRSIENAFAVGSIPPELRQVWNRLEGTGVNIELLERGALHGTEQGVDQLLQAKMLRDALDYNGNPGIAVLLTGDGRGFYDGVGFQADIARMHKKGWKIEVISWESSCNQRMKQWAEQHGTFIALDHFYDSITFLEPSAPGNPIEGPRYRKPLDLSLRPI